MKKFIITDTQLRQGNNIFYRDNQPFLKNGSNGIPLIEFSENEKMKKDLQSMLNDLLNPEIPIDVSFQKVVEFKAKYFEK